MLTRHDVRKYRTSDRLAMLPRMRCHGSMGYDYGGGVALHEGLSVFVFVAMPGDELGWRSDHRVGLCLEISA